MALEDPLLGQQQQHHRRSTKFHTMFLMFTLVTLITTGAYIFLITSGLFYGEMLKVDDGNSDESNLMQFGTFVMVALLACACFCLMLVTLVLTLAAFVLMVGRVIAFFFHTLVTGKKLVWVGQGDEEDIIVEAPTIFISFCGADFASSLFCFLAAIMGWKGTIYLAKGVTKLPADVSYDDLIYPILNYGFSLIALGLAGLFNYHRRYCCGNPTRLNAPIPRLVDIIWGR